MCESLADRLHTNNREEEKHEFCFFAAGAGYDTTEQCMEDSTLQPMFAAAAIYEPYLELTRMVRQDMV